MPHAATRRPRSHTPIEDVPVLLASSPILYPVHLWPPSEARLLGSLALPVGVLDPQHRESSA